MNTLDSPGIGAISLQYQQPNQTTKTSRPAEIQLERPAPAAVVELSPAAQSKLESPTLVPQEGLSSDDKSTLNRLANVNISTDGTSAATNKATLQSPSSVPLPHQQAEFDVGIQALDQANDIPKAAVALIQS